MANQHTLGPWDVRKHHNGTLIIATAAKHGDDQHAIALGTVPNDMGGHDNTRRANALLMSCAPDLLAAVEEALQDLNFSRSKVDGKSMTNLSQHVYLRLITARDKARGVGNG